MRKICIVGPSKLFLSGVSYYTIRLANALANENEVSVITFGKLLPKFLFPGRGHVGKALTELDFSRAINKAEMNWNSPLSWLRALNFLRKNNPEILIFQWWTASVGHMYLLLKCYTTLFLRKTIIIEMHELVNPAEESSLPLRLYSSIMCQLIMRKAHLVAHSGADKKLLEELYRIPEERIVIVPHGPYDHYQKINKREARERLQIREEEFVIFYFGLIRKYKGVEYLIDGFNKITEEEIRHFRLFIVGEVWDDVGLDEKVASSPYKDRIVLRTEYVPDEDVALYFSAADVVVLPYLRSSQSGVAHIAITYRLPIIVTEVGGLVESLSEYEGTIFIPPADSEAIKTAILSCYETFAIGEEKKSITTPELSWEGIAKRYEEIIERLT
jgi:glycosyltransferase involved in cell wall biosynthesis